VNASFADPTLIYIMGTGRSGTTLLNVLLEVHPSVSAPAELLKFHAFKNEDRSCSCGKALSECPFWVPVLERLNRTVPHSRWTAYAAARAIEDHHNLARVLLGWLPAEKRDLYLALNESLVRCIAAAHQVTHVVDSSKYVGRAALFLRYGTLPVRIIHVVRDPRGVAWSFGRAVQTPRGLLGSLLYFWSVQTACLLVRTVFRKRVLTVKYEDLVADPASQLETITKFTGIDPKPLLARFESATEYPISHLIEGNRFVRRGRFSIRPDVEWRERMGWARRILVWLLAMPFAIIYRYRP